jgi:hypothetical protein
MAGLQDHHQRPYRRGSCKKSGMVAVIESAEAVAGEYPALLAHALGPFETPSFGGLYYPHS